MSLGVVKYCEGRWRERWPARRVVTGVGYDVVTIDSRLI